MNNLNFGLIIPLIFADNAEEAEYEMRRVGHAYFGSDELAFPTEYIAESVFGTYTFDTKKEYVVRDVTVHRRYPGYRDSLKRIAHLRTVPGANAAEIEAGTDRLAREFFGSGKFEVVAAEVNALEASGSNRGKPGSTDENAFCAQHVVVEQQRRWSTV
ncbi:hypothetical protein E1281_07535 [Actinomadura sp. KC345]|uniref:hypothetical protein n=1 Tax=Actinomadura sp. KC345 TaxID=2530371 RepID=UPI0010505862|nr:hypothetical protein [Actinomadura sp. KC345]TDC56429.1 hypothetical protein E1281_07535 [Actinomadura sp. KC345]